MCPGPDHRTEATRILTKKKQRQTWRGCMLTDFVFLLWHTDAFDDEKLIGVYRTEQDALAAIERVRGKPGFSEEGGTFESCKYELNVDHWTEGFDRPVE